MQFGKNPVDHEIDFKIFYNVLRDIEASLHSGSEVKDVLDTLVRRSADALKANGAIIRLLNPQTHQLELGPAHGCSDQFLCNGRVFNDEIIAGECLQNKIIVINDILNDPHIQYPEELCAEGIRMVIDAPLIYGDEILGILHIFFAELRRFSEEEMNFLMLIAERGTAVVHKAKLIKMLESRYDQLALHTEKLSALGRMAAGIAHEINNPLAGILLFSTNMIKKVPKEGPVREGLEIIIQETLRCKDIIQDLLEFSREQEPTKVQSDINRLIQKAINLLGNEFRLSHIQLKVDLFEQLPKVLVDENQIEQVCVNLILNALQATEEQGMITIRSYLSPDLKNVCIGVSDTGCGIPPENITKIFEPFFSTKPKGTGLGLAVIFGIVQKHGGHINVSSLPGKGAQFNVVLPILLESSKTAVRRQQ
jgi:two-component system, NtrC family, sensor kinase